MRISNLILWLVIIVILLSVFAPNTYDSLKNKLTNKLSGTSISLNTSGNHSYELSYEDLVNNTNNSTVEEYSAPEDPNDPCTWHGSGLPNYEGTEKEGDTCASVPNNNDLECINNPPTNYDGLIDKLSGSSDPAMRCCLKTGYCQWMLNN